MPKSDYRTHLLEGENQLLEVASGFSMSMGAKDLLSHFLYLRRMGTCWVLVIIYLVFNEINQHLLYMINEKHITVLEKSS